MKNIHVLQANKPSRLYFSGNNSELLLSKEPISFRTFERSPQNIYITSDEEIKEGDWFMDITFNNYGKVYKSAGVSKSLGYENWIKSTTNIIKEPITQCKKIILTTDQDLIKDGVQSIDDEFLEWFVKNPSCEFVEVVDDWNSPRIDAYEYKIIREQFKKK